MLREKTVAAKKACVRGSKSVVKSVRKGFRRLRGKSDEEKAALLIQAQYRMNTQRRAWQKTRQTTVLLQAFTRGEMARKRTKRLRMERDALVVIMLWICPELAHAHSVKHPVCTQFSKCH